MNGEGFQSEEEYMRAMADYLEASVEVLQNMAALTRQHVQTQYDSCLQVSFLSYPPLSKTKKLETVVQAARARRKSPSQKITVTKGIGKKRPNSVTQTGPVPTWATKPEPAIAIRSQQKPSTTRITLDGSDSDSLKDFM